MLAFRRFVGFSWSCRSIVYYSKSHEYVDYNPNDKSGKLGLTDFAQSQLGDIVHLDLPDVSKTFAKGDILGVVESVKTVADIYAPISCRILRTNELLKKQPELINEHPETRGWVAEIKVEKLEELQSLLNKEDYSQICQKEKH